MSILWTIIIGFIAGVIAKFIMPGPNEPSGFILTTILGIVGAFVATFLGQALGWYRPGEGAGLIGAIVGAIIVLLVYGMIANRRTVSFPQALCEWPSATSYVDKQGVRLPYPCPVLAWHLLLQSSRACFDLHFHHSKSLARCAPDRMCPSTLSERSRS